MSPQAEQARSHTVSHSASAELAASCIHPKPDEVTGTAPLFTKASLGSKAEVTDFKPV